MSSVPEERRRPWATLPLHLRQQMGFRFTEQQWKCYALWYVGVSYQEIADMLGITKSTAVVHVRRAKQIREDIEREVPIGPAA